MRLARTVGFLVAASLGVLFLVGFNIWFFRYAKNSKELKGDSLPKQGVTFTDSRPTGQGEYACSPAGDCNLYSNEARKAYCTQTYADSSCLDQCGDNTKLCTK